LLKILLVHSSVAILCRPLNVFSDENLITKEEIWYAVCEKYQQQNTWKIGSNKYRKN
jgi:hypothetical protein